MLLDGRQRQVLEEFCTALRTGSPVAVGDPGWPAPVRRAAEAAVGRLSSGFAVFSSGSTDRPRGIVRSAASWQESVPALTELIGLRPDDIVGLAGPLSSSLYLHGAWQARQAGAEVRLRDEPQEDVTVLHAVPGRALTLPWPRGLRVLVVAGAVVPQALRARAGQAGVRLVEYYGSAEASFVLAGVDGATLRPFPGVQVAVDDRRQLWSRSSLHFERYLDGDGPAHRRDGWLTVGDLAVPDRDGWRLLGRPGTISTGGHTVVAADVEAALRDVPGVRDVVVCGLPHQGPGELGEVVAAAVSTDLSVAALHRAVRVLPSASRPRRLLVLPDLPRLTSGKVDRQGCEQALRTQLG